MPNQSVEPCERLALLEQTLEKWVAEYGQVERKDPVRALHLADAIADLQIVIARVQGESLWFSDPNQARAGGHRHVAASDLGRSSKTA